MKKRMFAVLMSVLLVLSLLPIQVFAAGVAGEYGDGISWTFNSTTGTLTVSGTGAVADCQSSENILTGSDVDSSSVKRIVIAEGITALGKYVFSKMSKVENVSIAKTVQKTDSYAFYGSSVQRCDILNCGMSYTDTFLNQYGWVSSVVKVHHTYADATRPTYCTVCNREIVFSGSCGTNARWAYDMDTATLTISGTGAMADYEKGSDSTRGQLYLSSNFYTHFVKKIVVEEGITAIGKYALSGYYGVTSVVLPSTLKSIGERAFYDNDGLQSIVLPDSVQSLGAYAFASCAYLKTISIPKSCTYIGDGCFRLDTYLEKADLSESKVTYIGTEAFLNCDRIEKMVVPKTCMSIGENAFQYTAFKELRFENCGVMMKNLVNIGVSYSYENIFHDKYYDGEAMHCYNCDYEEYGQFCGDSMTWEFDEWSGQLRFYGSGLMWDEAYTAWSDIADQVQEVSVEEKVESVCAEAFAGMQNLTTVYIADSVKSIGDRAFAGCTSLSDVRIESCGTKMDNDPWSEGYVFADTDFYGTNPEHDFWTYGDSEIGICENCGSRNPEYFCGEDIHWEYDYDTKTMTMTGTGAIWDNVDSLCQEAWSYLGAIKTLVLSEGITSLGRLYVSDMKVVNLKVPSTLTEYGEYAFCYGRLEIIDFMSCENVWDVNTGAGGLFRGNDIKEVNIHHTYEDDVCTGCGKKINNSVSLTVGGTVDSNVHMDLAAYADVAGCEVEDLVVAATYNHSSTSNTPDTKTDYLKVGDSTLSESGSRYALSVVQAPAQIAEDISIAITYKGETVGSFVTSGKAYCDAIIEGDYPENLKALCKAMVTYSAECQKLFNYNDSPIFETPADAEKYDSGITVDYAAIADKSAKLVSNDTALSVRGLTFMALANSALRLYLNDTADSASAVYVDDANSKALPVRVDNTKKYVEISGIAAADLDRDMRITIVKDGKSLVLTASALSYVLAAKDVAGMADICATIVQYNVAADAYFPA